MKQKLISLITAVTMMISLFGAMPLTANAANEHTHPVCGGTDCADPNHATHTDITWTAWESSTSLPTVAGNYYLTSDVTLDAAAE